MNVLTCPTNEPEIRIRAATAADGDVLVELASLVDLHRPVEEVPAVLASLRHCLSGSDDGPLSHGLNHFLFAENPDGRETGVIVCGTADWILNPGRVPGHMRSMFIRRISTVSVLAVRPEYRRTGIARALVQSAEEAFRNAGRAALTIRHDHDLTGFYEGLGYTSSHRLSMLMPTGELLTVVDRGWKHAFKILSPSVSTTLVQGLPTITGALD